MMNRPDMSSRVSGTGVLSSIQVLSKGNIVAFKEPPEVTRRAAIDVTE
jgi:hypothetical protein